MQKDQFYKYAEHPELLDKESIQLFTELTNSFPYFQTARLLLTKALHEQKNFYFDSQLKMTASYFTDRQRLHDFINYKPIENSPIEIKTEEKIVVEEKIEIINEPIKIIEPIIEVKPTEPVIESKKELVIDKKEEVVGPIIENKAKGTVIETEKEIVLDKKEKVEGPIIEIKTKKAIIEPEKEIVIDMKEEIYVTSILKESKKQSPPIEKVEENLPINEIKRPEKENKAPEIEQAHSFIDWLKLYKTNSATVKNPEIKAKLPMEPIENKNIQTKEKTAQEDIIEKFIKTEPKLPAGKKEFYSPINMAKLSVMENDDICSETLAKIYFDQGNFQRSKSMYERLSLKIPNKSSYFAARIKEINDIINK
jgi:hypothetical protein